MSALKTESGQLVDARWLPSKGTVYEFRVLLCPEEAGGFSAHVTNLPGIASQGETEEEALYNVKEALAEAIDYYKSESMTIPWGTVEVEKVQGSRERWILVDG